MLAAHMGLVAEKLLGTPNRQLSNGHELRYGTHGSLSVDREKGTWFDHEAGEGGGVLDLVRREQKCDRRAAVEWLAEHAGLPSPEPTKVRAKSSGKGRVVARYVYTDAEGRPVHCTLRFEPKSFGQQRFEDGRWIGGKGTLKGVQRVLYRLPELATADEVILAEGEKDADRLRSLGFTATTSPEGAGKWEDSFAETLAGKHVTIIPDNDPAGRKRIAKVADSLRGKAASVRVLDLKVPKKGGDVSDWLDAGHTADELQDLITKAPEWEPRQGDWRAKLLEGDQGPLACEANVEIALRYAHELAGRVRFNELSHAVECTALPWRACEDWRSWTDNDDTALAVWCQHRGMRVKPTTCAAAVQLVAADRPHHPVRAYLDGLHWDSTPRLTSWLRTYLSVTYLNDRHMAYVQAVGRKALIQAVARIYQAGCKADHALIFEGPQGALKSSAVRALVKEEIWFADEISDLGSKDSAQDLRGKWIIELAELSAMKRGDIERTKAFMSRGVDHYRQSYGRRSQDFPRQCVFFGTTNADAYLGDETGGRRFWPVKVGIINLDELRRDRDQLWAEAIAAYKAGEKWWLDAETEVSARNEQAGRRHVDVWEEPVLDWAARQSLPFTAADVLLHALKVQVENQDRGKEMRVAAILKSNGWIRRRASTGSRHFGYVREDEVVTEVVTAPEVVTAEVVTEGAGCDEVVTEKIKRFQCPSQPSQPSQPQAHTLHPEKSARTDVESGGVESLGKRLFGYDGCDVALGRRDLMACIYCGDPCSPSDMTNSIREPDGRWRHLDCEWAQP